LLSSAAGAADLTIAADRSSVRRERIPLKRNCDGGQQPQRRAGVSASRAREASADTLSSVSRPTRAIWLSRLGGAAAADRRTHGRTFSSYQTGQDPTSGRAVPVALISDPASLAAACRRRLHFPGVSTAGEIQFVQPSTARERPTMNQVSLRRLMFLAGGCAKFLIATKSFVAMVTASAVPFYAHVFFHKSKLLR
jgi:hypothetical protein